MSDFRYSMTLARFAGIGLAIGHDDARPHGLGVFDPFIEVLFVPDPIGGFEGVGIFETLQRAGLPAIDAKEIGPLSRRRAWLGRMAGSATRQELGAIGIVVSAGNRQSDNKPKGETRSCARHTRAMRHGEPPSPCSSLLA